MHCIEPERQAGVHGDAASAPRSGRCGPSGAATAVRLAVALLLATLVAGCGPPPGPAGGAASAPTAERPAPPKAPVAPLPQAGAGRDAAAPPQALARDWDDYRLQAARRIVAMNPAHTYGGPVPEQLLAIPVLQIELDRDGNVRRIEVLRRPGQALDTVQLAIDAVQRAAPFGTVAHLPRPWKFTETFLFNGQRRFKPRSLDAA